MSKKICNDCGCVIDTERDEYIVDAYGNYVCADCRDGYEYCYECEDYYPISDLLETDEGYLVCEDCANRWYEECVDCGRLCREGDMYYVDGHGDVCESCRDEYYYCEECGRLVHWRDWNDHRDMCNDCAEYYGDGIILDYHEWDEEPKFFYSAMERAGIKERPSWFMGFEWEWLHKSNYRDVDIAQHLTEILGDRVHHERDCTVDVETVFEPHTYEAIIESGEIKRAFDYAVTCMRDEAESAGLHVHVSREAFGDTREEQEDNIAKLVVLHTEGYAYDVLKKLSRRTDHAARWARPFRKGENRDDTVKRAKDYVGYRDNDHGVAINCGNYATVEFRLGAGTVNYDNFIAWIKIIKLLVDKCKEIKIEDASNIYLWLADADDSLKEYMRERGVEWQEPITVTVDDYRKIIDTLMDRINGSLTAQNAQTLDYNTMLAVLCNADTQTRVALGYM